MECETSALNLSSSSTYFKMSKNFFGQQKFFFRFEGDWLPFCIVDEQNSMHPNTKRLPYLRKVGANAITCTYEDLYLEKYQRVTVDFEVMRIFLDSMDYKTPYNVFDRFDDDWVKNHYLTSKCNLIPQ